MNAAFQNVHVRVNDAATGKPTPVRIRFVGADGTYYAPFGRLTEFCREVAQDVGGNVQVSGANFAYIDGSCEVQLPIEHIEVEIHKGPEYLPIRESVEVKQGKLSLRFEIRRWTNMRDRCWFSGDTHCYHLSPHSALLEGAAEDLAVVNLLATISSVSGQPPGYPNWDPRFVFPAITNITAFSGQRPCLEIPGHMVVVNSLNFSEFLGALALLNCHRVVYPLRFGPTSEPYFDWTLADLCAQSHRKGGLVIAHFHPRGDTSEELLADAVLGLIDAIEHLLPWLDEPVVLQSWSNWIEAGLRIPIVAGSGKRSNSELLGHPRTYAWLAPGDEFTYKNWIEAIRAGRTFATSGPMLEFKVNGQPPGALLEVPQNSPVQVTVSAESLTPFAEIECFFNQTLVRTEAASAAGQIWHARIELDLKIQEPGWLYARCRDLEPSGRKSISAIASPVYVSLPGQPLSATRGSVVRLLERLDESLAWVGRSSQFANEEQRQRMANVYLAAKQRLQEKLHAASG